MSEARMHEIEELGALRGRKQRALEAAKREVAQAPDLESAEALVSGLPMFAVDRELVSNDEFRDRMGGAQLRAEL